MEAVLLAARGSGDAFRTAFGHDRKCLVPAAGRPLVRWVLDALHASAHLNRVVVVGPARALRAAGVADEIVPSEGSYAESISRGLCAARGDRVLLLAADVPLLRAGHVDRYLRDALRRGADICFPVVSWEAMQARLPGVRKTWYDLRDGRYAKGNAALVRREAVLVRLDRVQRLFDARKQKQWAGLICPEFLCRLLGRLVSRREVELALSAYLGLRVRSLEAAPELAADVDEVGDVASMEGVLRRVPGGPGTERRS